MANVQNILHSIGISDIESDDPTENILHIVQKNIGSLHAKSEELTSRNLFLKVEIDKLKNNMILSEVLIIY